MVTKPRNTARSLGRGLTDDQDRREREGLAGPVEARHGVEGGKDQTNADTAARQGT